MSYIDAVEIKRTRQKYYWRWGINYRGKLLAYYAHTEIKKEGVNKAVYVPFERIDFKFLTAGDRQRFFCRENRLNTNFFTALPSKLIFSASMPRSFVDKFKERPFFGMFSSKEDAIKYIRLYGLLQSSGAVLYKIEILGRLFKVWDDDYALLHGSNMYYGTDKFRFVKEEKWTTNKL